MNIEIPLKVSDKMGSDERVVGYMVNLYKETIIFTKKGCNTKDGCSNFLYHSEKDFEKQNVASLDHSDLMKYEKHFISAFLWN